MRQFGRLITAIVLSVGVGSIANAQNDFRVHPDEIPVQFAIPRGRAALTQTSEFIRAVVARNRYNVNGQDLTVAVLDTGLNTAHQDFANRVAAQRNYTADNDKKEDDAKDGHGHGTNVSGIIVADGNHTGIAPAARIVPLKVTSNAGRGSWGAIEQALKWIEANHGKYGITVVNISYSDEQNHVDDTFKDKMKDIRDSIIRLRANRIPVVVAAGNDFATHHSQQGMGFPAICREAISVGAVFDANIGTPTKPWTSGAKANTTGPGRLTPFSQRLHSSISASLATDVFAPGAKLTSSGIKGESSESEMDGTSQAAPVVCGVILLAQQYYQRVTGELPTVDQVENWIWTGQRIEDGDDEDDNVQHTNLSFYCIDAMTSLANAEAACRRWQISKGRK